MLPAPTNYENVEQPRDDFFSPFNAKKWAHVILTPTNSDLLELPYSGFESQIFEVFRQGRLGNYEPVHVKVTGQEIMRILKLRGYTITEIPKDKPDERQCS